MDAIGLLAEIKSLGTDIVTLDRALECSDSEASFRDNWRTFFSQEKAKKVSGLVYVWATEKKIPRLKGESKVLYVGKTETNLLQRHRKYSNNGMSGNWATDYHVLVAYGKVKVHYVKCDKPTKAETKLLEAYYENHRELPPLNNIRFA